MAGHARVVALANHPTLEAGEVVAAYRGSDKHVTLRLARHFHRSETATPCPACDKAFISTATLAAHTATRHPSKPKPSVPPEHITPPTPAPAPAAPTQEATP